MSRKRIAVDVDVVRDMKLVCETILKNKIDVNVVTLPPTTLFKLAHSLLRRLEELDEEVMVDE
jgi:hypothetical protein